MGLIESPAHLRSFFTFPEPESFDQTFSKVCGFQRRSLGRLRRGETPFTALFFLLAFSFGPSFPKEKAANDLSNAFVRAINKKINFGGNIRGIMINRCSACPRGCAVDRSSSVGFCGASDKISVSRIALHEWEEPVISGTRGSGTIFFAGCNLRCVFCQNRAISASGSAFEKARVYTPEELVRAMQRLEEAGAHNINLVTPTHFARELVGVLGEARKRISIPIVYNSSGYESVESLRELSGLVDVYLPDLKYFSGELSGKYSAAPDYFEVASAALREMFLQVGETVVEDGLTKRGMIVRHLVLPGCRKDSMAILDELARMLPTDKIKLSLMRQYTPDFVDAEKYPELSRRITTFEYNSVLAHASALGFDGYIQSAESATSAYTPNFNCDDAFSV